MFETPDVAQSGMGTSNCLEQVRTELRAGTTPSATDILRATVAAFKANPLTKVPLLGMLTLDGKAYSLKDHFPFEPLFKVQRPQNLILKCARQVSKSTSMSADGVISAAATPDLKILFVTPRYEQVRRLSANGVRPFVNSSLIRPLLIDESCVQQVLQRSFVNRSSLFFSFAFLDCDRIRGLSVDWINYDEVQHLDYEFIPVINSTMNASKKGSVSIFSGTPLTLDNGIQALWEKSSKAEWVIKCQGCGKWNMASAQAELLKMIGLKGVVCAFCDHALDPKHHGRWYHTERENVNFHGYHVPQIIMPMHYADAKKWRDLISYREGHLGYTKQKFFNEILGESADFGLKLVTLTDIRNASVLGPNNLQECIDKFRRCKVRVLSVDWGGHGQEEISFTAVALVGLNAQTGKVECHYCKRFHVGASYDEEVRELLFLFREGACHWLAHDRCGAGAVREAMMIQAGMPVQRIIGLNYVRASTRDMVTYVPPFAGELRGYHSLDKARSLVLQAICIKSGIVLLPEYESSKEVTHDLLALMEDKHDSLGAGDIYLIRRQPKMPDDFANALNYGCIAIWHSEQQYPDLSAVRAIKLTQSQLDIAAPQNPSWR